MSLDYTDYINFYTDRDREELQRDVTTPGYPGYLDYTDDTDCEELRTDVTPAEEDNTPAATADTIRALAKSNISITFDGGSKHDRDVAIKEAVADANAIIAAHPKDNYRLVLERMAAKYNVTNVRFVGDDSVEIQLATPPPPAPNQWRDDEWGRSPQQLDKDIAADKQPDLVGDGMTTPITLSSIECRVVYALAAIISRPEELARDDVQRKIRNPYAPGQEVKRVIPLELLARMIFDCNRNREREVIWKALRNLRTVDQHIETSDGRWYDAPLILLGDKAGNRTTGPAYIEVTFGSIFFDGLDSRYAPIYPSTLFAAWRKGGRGTELFYRLLSLLLSIYTAAKVREAAIREGIKQAAAKATDADIERQVRAEMQRKKLQYARINVETLKRKIGRDYESKVQYAAAFWRDLDAAIEGMKEIGIITAASSTAATAQPGTKRKLRPRQIVFTINLDYEQAAADAAEAEEVSPFYFDL